MSKKNSLQKLTNLKSQVRSESEDLVLAKKYLSQLKGGQLQGTPKVNADETENLIHKLECLHNEKAQRVSNMVGKRKSNEIIQCEIKHPDSEIKNRMWEFNHFKIIATIQNSIQEHNYMPSVSEIARKTELSRQTVNKHIKEYSGNPDYLSQMKQFRLLAVQVLTAVAHYALEGDMRAARLYLESISNVNGEQNKVGIKTQNNYLQINNTLLTEEVIENLTPQQLQKIERIIKF